MPVHEPTKSRFTSMGCGGGCWARAIEDASNRRDIPIEAKARILDLTPDLDLRRSLPNMPASNSAKQLGDGIGSSLQRGIDLRLVLAAGFGDVRLAAA